MSSVVTSGYAHPPVRLMVVSDSLPERNGVGAYYVDLLDQLREHAFEAELLCPRAENGRFRFPLPGDSTQHIYWPSPPRFARRMRALKPQVIVVATPGPFGMMGARWSRKLGVPLLVGFHTHYAGVTDLYQSGLLRVLSRGYFRYVDRKLFQYADQVLANSDDMLKLAKQLGGRNLERIGTLLPSAILKTSIQPHTGAIKRILFAGRLAPEKRIHHVLETAGNLSDTDFVIAGDGPLRNDVLAASKQLSNLEYLGWLSREDLLEQMDASDALVMPSTLESFGNVALEAMARARIAVVTDTCGIVNWPELSDHLIRFPLEQSLTDVLQDLRNRSPEQIQARSEKACQAARELNRTSLQQWMQLLRKHVR